MLGVYFMELLDPVDRGWRTVWEDYATASFVIVVEPASEGVGAGKIR